MRDALKSVELELSPDIDDLRDLGLFAGFEQSALELLEEKLTLLELGAGQLAFREGDSGRNMFIVLRGQVEVLCHQGKDHEARVALISTGGWFGEVAMLGVTCRAVAARCCGPTLLAILSASALRTLYRSNLKAYAMLIMNLARELSRKLQTAERTLASSGSTPPEPPP